MEEPSGDSREQAVQNSLTSLKWYHTIDLGKAGVTPGFYDHRPYLGYYGLPKDLRGTTALDIGAASGFFSFELEKRGAEVTATELPMWMAHDFGPMYEPDMNPEQAQQYLHDPFLLAHHELNSSVRRKLINIYDIGPETTGRFDLVFCGSVLLHLTDPIRALQRIQSVTGKAAIIATGIYPSNDSEPRALFVGHQRGDTWWLPNRLALEAMVKSAGFKGWEWFSEFRLDFRNGQPGAHHGVIRAWNTPERPALLNDSDQPVKECAEQPAIQDSSTHLSGTASGATQKPSWSRFARWLRPG